MCRRCREKAWDRYVAQALHDRDNPSLAAARREREERDRAVRARDARQESSTTSLCPPGLGPLQVPS